MRSGYCDGWLANNVLSASSLWVESFFWWKLGWQVKVHNSSLVTKNNYHRVEFRFSHLFFFIWWTITLWVWFKFKPFINILSPSQIMILNFLDWNNNNNNDFQDINANLCVVYFYSTVRTYIAYVKTYMWS